MQCIIIRLSHRHRLCHDRMNEAIQNANRTKSPEEIAAEIAKEAERRKEEELAALKQKEEDEKAARAGTYCICIIVVSAAAEEYSRNG